MKDIDFLPARYRENDARRKAGVWRFALVLVLGGAVAAASLGQFAYRAKVQSQLVEIQPLLAQAHASEAHAAQLKSELHKVSQTATLYALVQTPWPRTQLVAAIVEPLDDTIVIHEIRCIKFHGLHLLHVDSLIREFSFRQSHLALVQFHLCVGVLLACMV